MKLSSKSLKIVCPIFGIKKPYSMFFSFTIKNPKLLKMEIKTNFGFSYSKNIANFEAFL